MAALSAGAAIISAADDTGRARVAALFEPGKGDYAMQAEISDLSAEIARLRSETRLLALEKEAMSIKIAALESEFGPITGSVPDAAAAKAGQVATAEIEVAAPKAVRTIDIGFVPLPVDRKNAAAPQTSQPGNALSQSAPAATREALAEFASPAARNYPSSITQTQFAIQLGIEETMAAARDLWKKLSQDHDPLIGRLEPAVAIAEQEDSVRIRLLAGPFADAAEAIQLCTVLLERNVDCRAVRSEGQRLVMR